MSLLQKGMTVSALESAWPSDALHSNVLLIIIIKLELLLKAHYSSSVIPNPSSTVPPLLFHESHSFFDKKELRSLCQKPYFLSKSKQLISSNDSAVSPKSLAILIPFRGKQCTITILSYSASSFGGLFTEICFFPLHIYWSGILSSWHSNEDWTLISRFHQQFVYLTRTGQSSFVCLLCHKHLNFSWLKILQLLPGGWVESLIYSHRSTKNK